jgi:hypothetical protein
VKYVPSALIGRLSRSAGSTTAAHNRYGAYLRNRVIPTNPQTPRQTIQRNALTSAAVAWRGLSAAQQAAWSALGLSMERTDTLGEVYSLTGTQAFISVNRVRLLLGLPLVSDAPGIATPDPLETTGVTFTRLPFNFSLTFAPSPLGDGLHLQVFATRALSTGRYFAASSEFKQLLITPEDPTSPVALGAAWSALYGAPPPAGAVLVQVKVLSEDGFASPPRALRALIT